MAKYAIVTWAEENTLLALALLALIIWGIYMLFFRKNGTTRIIERDIIDDTVVTPTMPVVNTFTTTPRTTTGIGVNTSSLGMAGARVAGGGGGQGGAR